MKSVVIHDTQDDLGKEILSALKEEDDTVFIDLNEKNLKPCIGCFRCWIKTPGLCSVKDDVQSILKEEINSQKVFYLCPVTWGGYSPSMKIYQDRGLSRILPFFKTYKRETHHPLRYNNNQIFNLIGYGEKLDKEEIQIFKKTGENFNDNIHGSEMNTIVIENIEDIWELSLIVKEEKI